MLFSFVSMCRHMWFYKTVLGITKQIFTSSCYGVAHYSTPHHYLNPVVGNGSDEEGWCWVHDSQCIYCFYVFWSPDVFLFISLLVLWFQQLYSRLVVHLFHLLFLSTVRRRMAFPQNHHLAHEREDFTTVKHCITGFVYLVFHQTSI